MANLVERDHKVAVVLDVSMEECPSCGDRVFRWEIAARFDGLPSSMLAVTSSPHVQLAISTASCTCGLRCWPVDPAEPPALEALREAVKAVLPPWAAPRRLVIVGALPRTALGKVRRVDLPDPTG